MDFVLVHGAWHGGWCWRKLIPFLASQGHRVLTPTLSGLGERSHLMFDNLSLDTHIDDIVNVLKFEDVEHCILVGHSYAGMIITGVMDRVPEKIAHLVYLDGVIPTSGENFLDCAPKWTGLKKRILATEGLLVAPSSHKYPYGVTNTDDAAWVRNKLTSHPKKTFTDKLFFDESLIKTVPRTYIHCTANIPIDAFQDLPVSRIKSQGQWIYKILATGHDAMVTEPMLVTNIICNLSTTM